MEVQLDGMTIGSVLRKMATERADCCFLKTEEKTLTYRQFQARVEEIARGLIGIGVKHGDHVALWAGNRSEWIECYMAVVSIGAVLVTVNTRFHVEELRYEMNQSDSKFLIIEDEFLKENLRDRALEVFPELKTQRFGEVESKVAPCMRGVISIDRGGEPGIISLDDLVERGFGVSDDCINEAYSASRAEDVALIIYTSGTTGEPKGAMQQHFALLNRVYRFDKWNQMDEDDVTFFALPFFHSFGAVVAILGTLVVGAQLCTMEKFRPHEALQTISREHATVIHGVPSAFFMMLNDPEFDTFDLSHGRTGVLGGAPCPPDLTKRIMDKIAPHIASAWGLTETCSMVTGSRPGDSSEQVCHSVGRVVPGGSAYVLDTETGQRVPDGVRGEIVVDSPYTMKGYYKMPEATAKAFDENGYFRTGDIGHFDEDGCLHIDGRISDMFIVGGVNAYPTEIENHIHKIAGVHDVQVVGVPEERLGEVACAYVVREKGSDITEEYVIDHCKDLANYKIPRYVRFVDEFPMTANGKVKKYVLRRMFANESCGSLEVG